MNRRITKSVVMVFGIFLLSGMKVEAQFMRTRISLPPGITSISAGVPQRILPRISTSGKVSSKFAWIELRAVENLHLVIDFKGLTSSDSLNYSVFLLNDGTENFAEASALMDSSFVLLRNIKGQKKYNGFNVYSAWVGIPFLMGRQTTIHYP